METDRIEEPGGSATAGAVDQHIDAAVLVPAGLDQRHGGRLDMGGAYQTDRPPTRAGDHPDGVVHRIRVPAIHHHPGSGRRQQFSHRSADAPAAADHDGCPPGEQGVGHSPFCLSSTAATLAFLSSDLPSAAALFRLAITFSTTAFSPDPRGKPT